MSVQTAKEVDEEAAAWALTISSGDLDAPYSPQLQAWLDGDPRRAGAFLRAQAALSFLDRARALEDDKPVPAGQVARPSRRALLTWGAGGSLMAAGLGGVAVLTLSGRSYATEVGEIRRVPLEDGSKIDINTASRLRVALHAHDRDVDLIQGEAWFEVSRDPARPFLVRLGDARVKAVGGAFSLRKLNDQSHLQVTDGVCEAWLQGARNAGVMVAAGSKMALGPGLPLRPVKAAEEIERSLAWRNGQISFDGESLADAAAEFNRYNRRPLLIEDPSLAKTTFVGLFRIDDPRSFAMAVAASSGAQVIVEDNAIRLK